ncbi:hypothetical protein BJV77DRAFT_1155445 [Russula vinacea]|nr:hypothetical protein BJV77DRAFT_1155445 [Russula vinacea]
MLLVSARIRSLRSLGGQVVGRLFGGNNDYRRSNVTVGLVCGPLRPGGCGPVSPALWRSVGVLREPRGFEYN